jgi:hypothetical protein
MTRHALTMLAAGSLAALGLAACAHRGVKPAVSASTHKPAVTAPSAATATQPISAAPEAASTVMPESRSGSVPAKASVTAAPASSMPSPAPQSEAPPVAATTMPASTALPPAAASATMSTAASAAGAAPIPNASTAAPPVSEMTGPSMPVRGMSMANVEHIFGAPLQKLPAVPDPGSKLHPPITRWIYPTYVVYFEYNYVVHTVLKAHPFADSKLDRP